MRLYTVPIVLRQCRVLTNDPSRYNNAQTDVSLMDVAWPPISRSLSNGQESIPPGLLIQVSSIHSNILPVIVYLVKATHVKSADYSSDSHDEKPSSARNSIRWRRNTQLASIKLYRSHAFIFVLANFRVDIWFDYTNNSMQTVSHALIIDGANT